MSSVSSQKPTRYRWVICSMLFFATTINYLDRQVLSLLQPLLEEQFHWTDNDYGTITAVFSLLYAISLLFAGRFVDRVGTKRKGMPGRLPSGRSVRRCTLSAGL